MGSTKPNFSVVGKSLPRLDGPAKVRGKAEFTDDLKMSGMLYGSIKQSTVGHAIIKNINFSKALKLPGVVAVITGKDAPKPFSASGFKPTETALAVEKVTYYGEGVAAVAAIDEATAEDACELIEVEYEELPVLTDPEEALKSKTQIHEWAKNNITCDGIQEFGDVDDAMKKADFIVENTYKSSYVNNAFLEPHAALAHYEKPCGKLTIHAPNQLPHYMQLAVSQTMEVPMEKVRIISPMIGGGFGGKTDPTPAAVAAAMLSRKTGRPVKIANDRKEVFLQNKGRHPAIMKIKMGLDKEGNILGLEFDSTLDGGAHTSWGLVVFWFTAALLQMPYKVANSRFSGRRVFTNKPACGAQRGLAGVQVKMAMESLMDEAAHKLGMNPYELRKKNAVETGYKTPSVTVCGHSEFKKCLDTVVKNADYNNKVGQLPYGKGIGLAGGHYSSGGAFLLYRSLRPHSTANIKIDTEAGITVFTGATDIGQGATTVIPQMVAEIFGVDYTDVNLVIQDTMLTPMDNGTMDSRVTYGAGHAVKNAAMDAKKKLQEGIAPFLETQADKVSCELGKVCSIEGSKKEIPFIEAIRTYQEKHGTLYGEGSYTPPQPIGDYPGKLIGPSPAFGFTAQIAEVEVDLETGKITIPNYYEAGDCGQPINPMSVHGQVEGAISMGLGQALYEEMIVAENGEMMNTSFHGYRIPTTMDMPPIHSEIVESYDPGSSFGNKEVGEGPTCAVIPAILNAIYDAIGIRFTEVPVTPEKVLFALKEKEAQSK
ncbi:xanthine dehydrogenase family protein molybdopterin-binding subunit [Spirochaetota bacterium]